jgi:DNA invertase Pin-like site-specific DNA recombinase
VIPYIRVSTGKQADSGLGLEAQQASISGECSRRDWEHTEWYVDVESSRNDRPALQRALVDVRSPDIGGLIVAKLDRIGRSTHEVSGYIEAAVEQKWMLVSLAPVVDMTTPYGRAMAQMACVFSELERAMISQRTSEALQAKIARGEWVGRPPQVGQDVEARVWELRMAGYSAGRIAAALDAEGFTPPTSDRWSRYTVRTIIQRVQRDRDLGRDRHVA